MKAEGRHVAAFFADDDVLASEVADFVGPALAREEPALLIATAPHSDAILDALGDRGADPTAEVKAGNLVLLDAAPVLDGLLVGRRPSAAKFQATVGDVVSDLSARGTLTAYGEMVGLLWGQHNPTAAQGLESLWNVLVAESGIELLCGYPRSMLGGASLRDVNEVCRSHAATALDPPMVSDTSSEVFLPSPTAAAAARRFVSGLLADHPQADDVVLVTSELVTNAVRHAASALRVTVQATGVKMRVEVEDVSSHAPAPAVPGDDATGGRGLLIVERLAHSWGYRPTQDGGKVVWAELAS